MVQQLTIVQNVRGSSVRQAHQHSHRAVPPFTEPYRPHAVNSVTGGNHAHSNMDIDGCYHRAGGRGIPLVLPGWRSNARPTFATCTGSVQLALNTKDQIVNRNGLYLLIGALLVAVVGLGVYAYREETKPAGVELKIGEGGVSIEEN